MKWNFVAFSGTHQTFLTYVCMACFLTSLRSLLVSLYQQDFPWQPNLKLQPLAPTIRLPILPYWTYYPCPLLWAELCTPKRIWWSPNPLILPNMFVFGDRIFKEIKLKLVHGDGSQPNMSGILIRTGNLYTAMHRGNTTYRCRESRLSQAKEWGLRRNSPASTLIPDFGLWNCERIHFCCLSHPVCGTLFWP